MRARGSFAVEDLRREDPGTVHVEKTLGRQFSDTVAVPGTSRLEKTLPIFFENECVSERKVNAKTA